MGGMDPNPRHMGRGTSQSQQSLLTRPRDT